MGVFCHADISMKYQALISKIFFFLILNFIMSSATILNGTLRVNIFPK